MLGLFIASFLFFLSSCASSSGGDVVSNGLMPMNHQIEKDEDDVTVTKVRRCLRDKSCYQEDANKIALQKLEKQLKAKDKLTTSELRNRLQDNGVFDKQQSEDLSQKIIKY